MCKMLQLVCKMFSFDRVQFDVHCTLVEPFGFEEHLSWLQTREGYRALTSPAAHVFTLKSSSIEAFDIMSLPYGQARALQGSYGLKRRTWELVTFADHSLRRIASPAFAHAAQAAIHGNSTSTKANRVADGVLLITCAVSSTVPTLAQSIRRWTAGTSLQQCVWHVLLPCKYSLLTRSDIETMPVCNIVTLHDIVPHQKRKAWDRDGFVIFEGLADAATCKLAMGDICEYVRNAVKTEFGLDIQGDGFHKLLDLTPQQWAASIYKKGQFAKAFDAKLGGGDFLRVHEIVKNPHVSEIQMMLKPFVSSLVKVKQERLRRVEEGASLKADGFAAGEDHLDLKRKLVQIIVALSETATVRLWPGSHKLDLKTRRGSSKTFARLDDNPAWKQKLAAKGLTRRDIKIKRGDVCFMVAGKLLHGIAPGVRSLSVKTYARYDPR